MDESAMRLTARVAPYIDAIKQKRAAGWRWKDVTLALGFACSDHSLAQAVKSCKWVAEQRPLLEPMGGQKTGVNTGAARPGASLARVGQKVVDSEDDGLTAAQRVLARIPKIGE